MKKGIAKFTAFCLAAGMTFGGTDIVSLADGVELSMVGIGAMTQVGADAAEKESAGTQESPVDTQDTSAVDWAEALADGAADSAEGAPEDTDGGSVEEADGETAEEAGDDAAVEAASSEDVAEAEDTEEPAEEEAAPLDTSMVGTTGIAQCSEYINIRATADTSGEVVGKLYNNSAVYIEDVDENGWYKVSSGNAEGYVASQYIVIGDAAEALSSEVGYHVAEVGAEVLNVRAAASEDAEIITTVTNTQEVEVIEDLGDWLRVAVDSDCYGYVSADYVNTEMQYRVAETIDEEQARLEAEYQAYLDEQARLEAEYAAYVEQQEAEYQAYVEQQAYTDSSSYDTGSYSDAQAAADAAYQEYLSAQEAADAATLQADEQQVYDTAAYAQEKYAEYLSAQAAADAAAVGAAAPESTDTDTEDYYTEEYTDYTEDVYVDDEYDDTYYEEEIYTEEEYGEDSYTDNGSSLGQQIANYACQFVGNPYVWGGSSLTNGADCSGFTMAVYSNFGVGLPHSAAAQSGCGTPVDLGSIQPGDLLFYSDGSGIGHVTMYIGNGQVVHASSSTTGIIISDYSYRTPVCARRLV